MAAVADGCIWLQFFVSFSRSKKQSKERKKGLDFFACGTVNVISAIHRSEGDIGFNYPSVFADLEGIEESEATVVNCVTSASSLSNAAILRRS